MPKRVSWWEASLAGGVLAVGVLTLAPVVAPQPRVPQVTRLTLPEPVPASVVAPVYPRTSSVEPLISGRLNVNTATQEQLEALPKIGPALAERIIAGRPYRSLADLDKVKGIGESTLAALTPRVKFQ